MSVNINQAQMTKIGGFRMFTQDQRRSFNKIVESLKKYRRADLLNEDGESILDDLYVDLLPNDIILERCLQNNTTFLIGRKGTGKSTLFLKLENEYRKQNFYFPCYIDVKTVYESSQAENINSSHLQNFLSPEELERYLLQRTFIQNVLKAIYSEIDNKQQTLFNKLKGQLQKSDKHSIKEKIANMLKDIDNNKAFESIEIPILQHKLIKHKENNAESTSDTFSLNLPSIKLASDGVELTNNSGINSEDNHSCSEEYSFEYSEVLLKVFNIKSVIENINEILEKLGIKHLVIMLDDTSEIEVSAIKTFIDTIVAPLNNWSNEFIKFKIAFYPNRIHYGKIDPGKIDTINLDFYNLYSEFNSNKMTEIAVNFTERLLTKRFKYYKQDIQNFFDTSEYSMDDYYELLFNVSMNVPRITGYILSFVYQSKIIHDKKISRSDIQRASQKYYEEKINVFFEKSVHCLLSKNERKSIFELQQLVNLIVNKSSEIKTEIVTEKVKGLLYNPAKPYTSHFHVDLNLEKYLESLELNHFITKYSEQKNRDGLLVSIYCLNYGLATKNSILWGRDKSHTKYRKYFIERAFDYTQLISTFLADRKIIICSNKSCNRVFEDKDLPGLEFTEMHCPSCHSKVIIDNVIDPELSDILNNINDYKQLPECEYKIMVLLHNEPQNKLRARDIAEEIDFSSIYIANQCKKLKRNYSYVDIDQSVTPYTYSISETGLSFFS